MFDPKKYRISEGNFESMKRMIEDNKVTLDTEEMPCNPNINIKGVQQKEEIEVRDINDKKGVSIIPRKITADMYRHSALVLRSGDTTRKIVGSIPKEVYDSDGSLIPNGTIKEHDSVPEDFLGIYYLHIWLRFLSGYFWDSFVVGDIYAWAERYHCSHLLTDENSYLYESFDYYKDVTQSLIDIFGYDVMEKAVRDFSVCDCCGEKFGER